MSDLETIEVFAKVYERVCGMKFQDGLLNLVMFDSLNLAGDNAEYLYRQIRKLFPYVNMTFVIQRGQGDWDRLDRDGFNLMSYDDPDLQYFLNRATFILFSKDVKRIHASISEYRSNTIFLQHGIFSRINNCSFYAKGTIA